MFKDSGDALKNYYTYAYYISHNESYSNFEGMNYPYGESYLYTDCHPIFATTFKFLSTSIPFFSTHSIGVLNFLLIFYIFLSFIVVHRLLVELKIDSWYSILFSISIVMLAPQAFSLDCHQALSYTLAIPLSWLLLLKFFSSQKHKHLLFLFLNNLFWLLIHAYLGIIIFSFLLILVMIELISERKLKLIRIKYLKILGALLLPVFIFLTLATSIEMHEGRTNNPSGFFLSNAELDDVFVPYQKPLRPLLDKLTGGIIRQNWEARGYVGLTNSLIFISLAVMGLTCLFLKKPRQKLRSYFDNHTLNKSLIAATVVLLFSFGVPFKQLPFLLDWFPVLKQFRATGRFVWPFYFVFAVFGAYIIQKITRKILLKNRSAGITFLLVAFLLNFVEGLYNQMRVAKKITACSNIFNQKFITPGIKELIHKVDPKKYQAIISLPFYYYGSESYTRLPVNNTMQHQILISYHTGLPCVNANLTRTSISESKNIVQIVSPNYYEKKVIDDIQDERPFLVAVTENELTKYENVIKEKANKIGSSGTLSLFSIDKQKLFSDDGPKVLATYKADQKEFIKHDSFLTSDTCSVLYYNSFEDSISKLCFRGKGGLSSTKKGEHVIDMLKADSFKKDAVYDISIWMSNKEPDALNLWFRLLIEEYEPSGNKCSVTTIFPEHAETIHGNWSLVEGTFKVHNPENQIVIKTIGKEDSKASFHADDLLIKDAGVDVYKLFQEDNTLFYNNHEIKSN